MSDGWFLSGIYYGYPVCCIDEFIHYGETDSYEDREKRKLCGTGYVPCEECNKKSEEELVEAINNNRLHWQKFPTCSPNSYAFVDFTHMVAATFLENWSKE
jgi:hypothetical protein